ncbi:MAG: DNA-3-methyladenine glycosylase I [Deltaproteobacteria bacterium]|nr:DNA-3-methyladenine glycosylase I [Deltaproteobacteria bacterium]
MKSHSTHSNQLQRCPWCGDDPLYVAYHDEVWGIPVFNDSRLFEFLVLETAQAGLSWITILRRQEGYRRAFAGFDVQKVAAMTELDQQRLLEDTGIIRNKKKIAASICNARKFIEVQNEFGTFSQYCWQFTNGKPIQNRYKEMSEIPPHTSLSNQISKDMRKRGFQFVGPTVMYAFMQATGMVNDHLISCYRYKEIRRQKNEVM